jgi:tetratricopeptide (TPR) repeat protein
MMGLEQEVFMIREETGVMTLLMLGKPHKAVEMQQARYAHNPENGSVRRNLGLALAAAGDYDRARPLLEALWLEKGKRISRRGAFRGHEAVALIGMRHAAGEDAGELLEAMREYVRRLKEAGITGTTSVVSVDYLDGITAFLSGERETGLSMLARSVEKGAFILPNAAYLQTLYENPGFLPIKAQQKAHRAHEREQFLAVVCRENPYQEVWQPAEETCQRFLPVVMGSK